MSPLHHLDGRGFGRDGPDPHGQAALLLVESLIHVMVEKGLLTREEALDAVQTSTAVKTEIAKADSEPRPIALASLALLKDICLSFDHLKGPREDGDGDGRADTGHAAEVRLRRSDGDGRDGDGRDGDGRDGDGRHLGRD